MGVVIGWEGGGSNRVGGWEGGGSNRVGGWGWTVVLIYGYKMK